MTTKNNYKRTENLKFVLENFTSNPPSNVILTLTSHHWLLIPVLGRRSSAQTEIFANPGWKIEKSSNQKYNNTAQKVVLSSANTLLRRINRGRTQIIKPYWHHTDLDRSNFQNITSAAYPALGPVASHLSGVRGPNRDFRQPGVENREK